jgi:hypothetical protein
MDSDFKQQRQAIYTAMRRERPRIEQRTRAITGRYRVNLAREWRLYLERTLSL